MEENTSRTNLWARINIMRFIVTVTLRGPSRSPSPTGLRFATDTGAVPFVDYSKGVTDGRHRPGPGWPDPLGPIRAARTFHQQRLRTRSIRALAFLVLQTSPHQHAFFAGKSLGKHTLVSTGGSRQQHTSSTCARPGRVASAKFDKRCIHALGPPNVNHPCTNL